MPEPRSTEELEYDLTVCAEALKATRSDLVEREEELNQAIYKLASMTSDRDALSNSYQLVTTERNELRELMKRAATEILKDAFGAWKTEKEPRSEFESLKESKRQYIEMENAFRKALEAIGSSDGGNMTTTGEGHAKCIHIARAVLEQHPF